jgi:hypothetical protein
VAGVNSPSNQNNSNLTTKLRTKKSKKYIFHDPLG